MVALRCEAVRWVDDEPFPGLVEVRFEDADGRCRSLIDKAPIFDSAGELGPDSPYPVEVAVECVIRHGAEPSHDNEVVTVSTAPHQVTDVDGSDEFTVRPSQLVW